MKKIIKITSAKLDKDDFDSESYVWKIYFDYKVVSHSFYVDINAKSGKINLEVPYGGGGGVVPPSSDKNSSKSNITDK